jgi:hypothetical protein
MGKKAPKAPDYTPLANASNAAAQMGYQLGREQLDFARQQYDDLRPLFDQITQAQISAQDETTRMGRESFDRQKSFWGLEDDMISKTARYNTEAEGERLARLAATDSARAFGQTQAMNERSMASMGVNPNSGRFAGLGRAAELSQGAVRANAMTTARDRADQLGYARTMDAIGLGKGLSGAGLGAYGAALNAGNSAGQNAMAPGENYMRMYGQGAGTIQQGQQMQIGGLGNILGTQASVYNNYEDPLAAVAGMALQGYATYAGLKASDRRLKTDIERVGTYPNGLPMYEFAYKADPNRVRYRGVMADEVEVSRPDAVATNRDGFKYVRYDRLGFDMERAQ